MNGFRCMILGKLTIDYTIFQFSCSNRIDKTQSMLHGKSTFLLTTKKLSGKGILYPSRICAMQ